MTGPRLVRDATGATLEARSGRSRVVSLVPSLTEAVADLGRLDALAAVTPYCTSPTSASLRPRIGGPLEVDVDAVASLGPDLVLASVEENAPGDVLRLRGMGVPVHVVSPRRALDAAKMLEDLGALLGADDAAAEHARRIREAVAIARSALGSTDRVRVTCPVWPDPPMVVGTGTYAADLLSLAGGDVVPSRPGYPRLARGEAEAQVVLLPDEPFRFSEEDLGRLGLDATEAARLGRVHLVDGRTLFWYGARAGAAIQALAHLLGHRS
jgi:ABC-type hemin transport system substrate-binding protein